MKDNNSAFICLNDFKVSTLKSYEVMLREKNIICRIFSRTGFAWHLSVQTCHGIWMASMIIFGFMYLNSFNVLTSMMLQSFIKDNLSVFSIEPQVMEDVCLTDYIDTQIKDVLTKQRAQIKSKVDHVFIGGFYYLIQILPCRLPLASSRNSTSLRWPGYLWNQVGTPYISRQYNGGGSHSL